ncbi:MAG: glycoside hydrolase, partial [Vicinamibacterales bacterium]
FWILDDVTPLRQQAELKAANGPFLYKPATGVRVRFAMNDPTPWPPELPAGENPPPGALVDYYLPTAATGEVKLEILNSTSKVIRTYSSNDPVRDPDPAKDPVAYNKLCQATPTAADCGLPLYWPAPQQGLSTAAGDHRFSWDMHYDLLGGGGGGGRGGGGGGGAVPHRTYGGVNSPWVAPGAYTVRLTVDGKSSTQPITVKMDPRVKDSLAVQQIYTLTTQAENNAIAAEAAVKDARDAADKLRAKPQSAATDALIKEIDAIAPPAAAAGAGGGGFGGRGGGGGRGGRGGARGGGAGAPGAPAPAGGPPAAPAPEAASQTLASIGPAMVAAVMPMQSSEMAPTAAVLKACQDRQAEYTALMAKWNALKLKLKAAGV